MTNALDPKTPILKGVITEVLDDGNAGKINCGHGNIYTFVSDQLETGYLPVLKDVVEFNLIEDQPFRQLPAFFYSLPRGSLKTATVA